MKNSETMKTIKELDNEIKEIRCTIESLNIRLHAYIQQAEERFIRVETNSMAQANENLDNWRDARDVEKALIDYCHGQEPSHRFTPTTILDLRAFAKFYAQRCGVELERSKDE
jgi:hypothetical protein